MSLQVTHEYPATDSTRQENALLDPVASVQHFINSFGVENTLLSLREMMHRQEEIDIPDVSDTINAATVAQLEAQLLGTATSVMLPTSLADRITQVLTAKAENASLTDEQLLDEIVRQEVERDVQEEEEHIEPERVASDTSAQQQRRATVLTRKQIRHQERVVNCILSNKRSILTKIALGTLSLVAAYGVFTALLSFGVVAGAASGAAASGFGFGAAFPAWFSTFYAMLRKLGLDKAIIQRMFLLAQQNESMRKVGSFKPISVSPRLLRIMKRYNIPDTLLEASLATLTEKFVTEGLALTSAGGVASYVLTTGVSSTLTHAPAVASASRDAAIRYIGAVRKLLSPSGLDKTARTLNEQSNVFHTVQAVEREVEGQQSQTTALRRATLTTHLRKRVTRQAIAEQAAVEAVAVSKALRTAGAAGATLALGLYRGQIVEMASSVAHNSFVQTTAIGYLVQYTGLPRLVSKYGALLTVGALGQLTDLSKPLQDPKTKPHERDALMRSFFALLLGKQIYSDEQIQSMSIDQIKSVFKEQHVHTNACPTGSASSSVVEWRKALLRVQQERLVITKQELVTSITTQILTTVATTTLVQAGQTYADTIRESINLRSMTDAAGITEDEIAAVNVTMHDPEFASIHLQPGINYTKTLAGNSKGDPIQLNALRGIEKLNSLLQRNPLLAGEMSSRLDAPSPFANPSIASVVASSPQQPMSRFQDAPAPLQQPQSRLEDAPVPVTLVGEVSTQTAYNIEMRAQLRAIRAERQAQAKLLSETHFKETVEKFATRFGLSTAQVAGIKSRQELQQAINQAQTSTTTRGLGTRTVEMGSLTEAQLIDKTVLENARKIEFDPLYYQVRDATVRAGASWIPGVGAVIEKTNLGIDALNASKNVWNLGVAFNQMMGYSEFVKENAGFMPFADIPKFKGVADVVIEQLGTKAPKVNVGDVFLRATIQKIQEQWTTTQFISEIALQILGKDAAKADIDKLVSAMS